MNKKILLALLNKLKELWKDKRPYTKRLICAGAAMLAACFTFLFFGPLEMVAFAADSLDYGYKDILLPLGLLAGGVFLLGSGLIALLRGKVFNCVVTAVFGATVCGYLQAAFMNGNFGLLNGEPIDWPLATGDMVINFLIWVLVFVVLAVILYLHKKFWRNMVTVVSIILVVMQLAPTIGILAGGYKEAQRDESADYFISMDGINEYSKKDNVFVFVLDYMDFNYIKSVLAKDPTFFDRLDGFTGYRDAIPNFTRTHPALNAMLTGSLDLPYRVEKDAFFSDSWTDGGRNILETLQNQDYSIDLYASFQRLFSDVDDAKGYVSNLATNKGEIRNSVLLKKMINFSAYRYLPIAMKPFFWADTNFYNEEVYKPTGSAVYVNEQHYYTGLFQKATADREEGSFKFYHFYGSHPPYKMNAEGEIPGGTTSVVEATMGGFNILYKAFDRMKELGIYEDATILITADHGNAQTLTGDKLTMMQIGMFYKPAGSAGTPLAWSDAQVSTANIPATLVKAAGGDYSAYGTPLDEVEEGKNIERVFYRCIMNTKDWNDDRIQVYEINGKGDVFENWVKVEEFDILDENKLYG